MKIALPCGVLPVAAREEAARRLGITVEELVDIVYEELAWRDGKLFDETTFLDTFPSPEDDWYAFTGARVLPADLVVHEIEVRRDPRKILAPPISSADVVAADVLEAAEDLRELIRADATGIELKNARIVLQKACQEDLRLDTTASQHVHWQPWNELMVTPLEPGAPCSPLVASAHVLGGDEPSTKPARCAFVADGFLVQFCFASVAVGPDGEVRDVFETFERRAVSSDARHVLFDSHEVRDLVQHRWLTGAVPESLPRFVAGRVSELDWAVVLDVAKGVGYRMAPRSVRETIGSGYGTTRTSACGRYAWDQGRFVLDAATGAAVLDARDVKGELVSFARREGGWRFILSGDEDVDDGVLRIVDGSGSTVRELGDSNEEICLALSAEGTRILRVSSERLRMFDVDTGRAVGPSFDLRPLLAALTLPEDVALWRAIAARFAVPVAIAGSSPAEIREAVKDWPSEDHTPPTDEVLVEAIRVARDWPAVPSALPPVEG